MLPAVLRGARTHNLKNVSLTFEPGELVCLTGPSGAGKSSLAIDTIYAEGQRRFVESFSPYARQFLERLPRPPIDSLDPVAATVAVDRRAPIKSSRSTLATMADLEPYLAGLFAREAVPMCPDCGELAVPTAAAEAVERLLAQGTEKERVRVSYVVRAPDAEAFLELRETLAKEGYRRLVVGGTLRDVDDVRPSEATAPDVRLEVVLDRTTLAKRETRRLQQAVETAWLRGEGRAELLVEGTDERAPRRLALTRGLACPRCSKAFEPARAALFSYNSPLGACPACRGFGRTIEIDWEKVIPDASRSLAKGAIRAWSGSSSEWERETLTRFAKKKKIPLDVPWASLTNAQRALVLDGEGEWEGGKYPGVRAWFKWLESRTYKMHVRVFLARYRDYVPCTACQGARLGVVPLSYRVGGKNLRDWHAATIGEARASLDDLVVADPQGKRLQQELGARLRYLEDVGLAYLTLDRQARTLSGGEAQRAGLTTALGASLTGALFVLDEPTVGLHALDVPALGRAIQRLADAGNGVVLIEHDRTLIESADRVIELGPGAGHDGGHVLFDGTPAALAKRTDLPTGAAWRADDRKDSTVTKRRSGSSALGIRGASANNLANVDVDVPLGVLCALTGPSGSGKSTLAGDVIYRAVARALGDVSVPEAKDLRTVDGIGSLKRAVLVDQSPLGRTARGNAATYTKAWDRFRARFGAEPGATMRGLGPSHFSFNVGGPGSGRCETCSGEGYETVEMQFLADVAILCAACLGKRFRPEVLAVKHGGLSVAEVLELPASRALELFHPREAKDPVLYRALSPLVRVGLGYLPLGQPLSTLSGGEAQRLKLARALAQDAKGALFVVDEPSAGLHGSDTRYVIDALRALVDEGASVLVVEHDLDVIRSADWIIDLGPGGGPAGGRVVAQGTPEDLAASDSRTGIALRERTTLPRRGALDRGRAPNAITVENATEHNLKHVSCSIPHGKLSVVTGPSGSGKSSLAFDVVFAEGQRRFMETLTPYARQFLPTLPRPDVERVLGVPPSIALEQRLTRAGGNSTVATVTEAAHYLRLLYAKVGELHCPRCDAAVQSFSEEDLFRTLVESPGEGPVTVYAPAVRARKGTYLDLFTQAARAGLQSARVDGAIVAIDPPPRLQKALEHTVDLIVHYGPLRNLERSTYERALAWGDGALRVRRGPPTAAPHPKEELWSTARTCPKCGTGVPEVDPRTFSFNTKQGQCERCEGRGTEDPEADIGDGGAKPCRECGGTRLSAVPRGVRLFGNTYPSFLAHDVASAHRIARNFRFQGRAAAIADAAHKELLRRLAFIENVGLGYLALDRAAYTLSGGEMQRLRLSAQIGSGLTGALYVLDEPTIGLHPRDTGRLLDNLRALTKTGSTVLVVEHDAETIAAADHVLDLGPHGGRQGGHVMAQGPADEVLADPRSPTAAALLDRTRVVRANRNPASSALVLGGASAHNLKNVTFSVPVGRLTVVAGVSGSGKSTLVRKIFYPALRRTLGLVADEPLGRTTLKGARAVKRAVAVDQSPIGRTPRSVPATFLGIWDDIRRLFASLPDAKVRGYTAARFSFNTGSGGRCAECDGQGVIVSEMSFLPDVVTPCASCGGARFEPATLEIRYAGLSIGDVLRLSADDAAEVFKAHKKIASPLRTLGDLGVGYIALGQGSNTLSGGEAQRLKLAAELTAGLQHEPTVYVLDEPTTGLHLSDVKRLVTVLHRLVDRGDTLVVIEHHPDVIQSADWVVELGPEGGGDGGEIVFEGTPEALRKAKTATGRFLGREAKSARNRAPQRADSAP